MKVSFAETRAPVAPRPLVSEPSQGWMGWTSARSTSQSVVSGDCVNQRGSTASAAWRAGCSLWSERGGSLYQPSKLADRTQQLEGRAVKDGYIINPQPNSCLDTVCCLLEQQVGNRGVTKASISYAKRVTLVRIQCFCDITGGSFLEWHALASNFQRTEKAKEIKDGLFQISGEFILCKLQNMTL